MADARLVRELIILKALEQGVDARLAVAVAQQESGFNPDAVSPKGARGVMQLMPATARALGVNAADVGDNIRGGISYLKQQQQRFGSTRLALAAYNAGPQAVERYGGVPPYQETQDYVQRILTRSGHGGEATAPRLRASSVARRQDSMAPPQAARSHESFREELRQLKALEARDEELRQLKALEQRPPSQPPPTPQAPAGPPSADPRAGSEVEVIPGGSTPTPQPPGAATQLQMLEQQEQERLAAERQMGSPTVPALRLADIGRAVAGPAIGMAGGLAGAYLGQSLGGALGGAAGTPGRVVGSQVGTVVGEMAGSYLGRRANVALGFEEPGVVGDIASVAVPPAFRGASRVLTPVVKRVGKAVVRHLPGAATAMHQEVAERLTQMTDRLLPPVDSSTLYTQVAQYNPGITTTAVARDAAEILRTEMALKPSLRNGKLLRVAKDLQDLTASGTVPMDELYAHQQRVGELVKEARRKGGVGEGRIKQLYAAFHEDLETTAGKGVQGAQELKNAIAASRKEHVATEFDELFAPGNNGVTIDPEGRISLNGGRMETAWKRTLNRDKVFRDTLTPEEKAEVEGIIKYAQRLERLNVPKGGQRGSGRAAVGAAIGATIGGPAGAAVGVYGPELIAKAMQTQAGRRLVRRAMEETSKGGADTTALTALAALVRQQMSAPADIGP